jgi:hypothetical protein
MNKVRTVTPVLFTAYPVRLIWVGALDYNLHEVLLSCDNIAVAEYDVEVFVSLSRNRVLVHSHGEAGMVGAGELVKYRGWGRLAANAISISTRSAPQNWHCIGRTIGCDGYYPSFSSFSKLTSPQAGRHWSVVE